MLDVDIEERSDERSLQEILRIYQKRSNNVFYFINSFIIGIILFIKSSNYNCKNIAIANSLLIFFGIIFLVMSLLFAIKLYFFQESLTNEEIAKYREYRKKNYK
jgi:hypothetical protein